MAKRQYNSATEYYIAEIIEGQEDTAPTIDSMMEIASGIQTMDPDINEESEEFAYYDIEDGGTEEVVGGVSQEYKAEGHRFVGDPAQDFIASKEWDAQDRLVWAGIKDPDGTTYIGKATLKEIKVRGGDANDFQPIEFGLRFRGKPVMTKETSTPVEPTV